MSFDLLNSIIDNHGVGNGSGGGSSPVVISENHNLQSINWVKGLSDPGEMIACGAYQELRRLNGESDTDYQARIEKVLLTVPADVAVKIRAAGVKAAIARAGYDTSNGRVNMVSANGILPWAGLGVTVAGALNSAQALELSGANFPLDLIQASYTWQGQTFLSDDDYFIVRGDTGKKLGRVGNRYKAIQVADGAAFLDSVVGQFGASYETCGSLWGGRIVWMLIHFPKQSFTLGGIDRNEQYVCLSLPNDGSGVASVYPTSVRIECKNTHNTSKPDMRKGLKIRHTGNIKDKIQAAQEALGIAVESSVEYKAAAQEMSHRQLDIRHYANDVLDACLEVTQAQALQGADLLTAVLNVSEANRELERKSFEKKIERRGEVLSDILERYEQQHNSYNGMRGSAWHCFNSVTDHCDHNRVGRNASDPVAWQSRRFESALDGSADAMKQVAYEKALVAVR